MNKNFLLLNIIIYIMLLLTGCSKSLSFELIELKDNIMKVEILYYNDPIDNDILVSIEESDDLDEFLKEFSKLQLTITFGAPGNLEGYCIKLLYKDSSYYLITKTHMEYYNKDGRLKKDYRIDSDYEKFDELINNLL